MNLTQPLLPILGAILLAACASSYADASGGASARGAPLADDTDAARRAQWAPYRVEVEGADATTLPTYERAGRTYVMGTLGERYRVHITNPTGTRVEAVVSIDGLDAIDGEPGDFTRKRGYVIGPHADVVLEGFRTSLEQVATFRFSSVPDSYAARKGKDRNVGVIGVAFFPERAPVRLPAWRAPADPLAGPPRGASRQGEEERRGASQADATEGAAGPSRAEAAPLPPPAAKGRATAEGSASNDSSAAAPSARERRSGLGTEFGEARASRVDYTTFQRAAPGRPSTIVELRYNDRRGLLALGIDLGRAPTSEDLAWRETAEPFPARSFASPPPAR